MPWLLDKESTPRQKSLLFRNKLKEGKLLQFVGCFSPYIAQMAEKIGFDGVYISGAGIANDLGLPDISLTTLSEVTQRGRAISRCSSLPNLIDIDTGFGATMNVARTILEMEEAELSGCHIEDQVQPKRCGHLDNKSLISKEEMLQKITAAVKARRDSNFILCARTDAIGVEGLDKAIERAQAYVDAGADMIFPEAVKDPKDFEKFRKAVKVPLLANMTEFGKSELLDTKELESLGYNMVIYPMTMFRIAMGAVENALKDIKEKGHQKDLLPSMQTRSKLYEYLEYEDYNELDKNIFNFNLSKNQ